MDNTKKGYWVYSVVAVVCGFSLFGYLGYLIFDLVIKLSVQDFSNNTVIQALLTLIITVFIGGYFSKWLENKNAKNLELYKIKTKISLNIIDLASILLENQQNNEVRNLLHTESIKVKLYFSDDVFKSITVFLSANTSELRKCYETMIDELRNNIN